jgi:8-oxo-dGTP diphosphatase
MISVVAAFIKNKDKILIAQRAKGELKGKWEFPGGKIEPGETPTEAIIREIKEELSLEIVPISEINTFEYKYTFADIKLTLIQCNIVSQMEGFKSDGSHLNVQWADINQGIDFAPLDSLISEYLIKNKYI